MPGSDLVVESKEITPLAIPTDSCPNIVVKIPEIPDDLALPVSPSIKDITTETVDGTGAFDVFMRAGSAQLQEQFDAGRIKGAAFAEAHTAMMQLMMTEANKFVLGKVQSDIAIAMFPMQYMGAVYEAAGKEAAVRKTEHESNLICEQEAQLELDGEVNRRKVEEEIDLLVTQDSELILNGEVNRRKTEEEIDLLETQDSELILTGPIQREKLEEEVDLLQTQDSELLLTGPLQRTKLTAETDLLDTQEDELILNGVSKRALEGSQKLAADEQIELYRAQAIGFEDKNRNDSYKTLLNAWAISAVEVDADPQVPTSLTSTEINGSIQKANEASGLTPAVI